MVKQPLRKPPKHLPKEWPADHELYGELTPSEWVGLRLQELFERAWDQKAKEEVTRKSRAYDAYFTTLEDAVVAEIERRLRTAKWRKLFREHAQAFITQWGVQEGDTDGIERAHAHAWTKVRRDFLYDQFSDKDLRRDHMDAVGSAIAKDLEGLAPEDMLTEKQEGKYMHLLCEDAVPAIARPTAAKPQAAWPAIYEQVRTEVRARFGIVVSDGKLKKCLDAWRRAEKQLSG